MYKSTLLNLVSVSIYISNLSLKNTVVNKFFILVFDGFVKSVLRFFCHSEPVEESLPDPSSLLPLPRGGWVGRLSCAGGTIYDFLRICQS